MLDDIIGSKTFLRSLITSLSGRVTYTRKFVSSKVYKPENSYPRKFLNPKVHIPEICVYPEMHKIESWQQSSLKRDQKFLSRILLKYCQDFQQSAYRGAVDDASPYRSLMLRCA